jgi:hypothetical protein
MATTIEKQKRAGLTECTLNDILFPVKMVEQKSFECNSDYAYDIFGFIGGNQETVVDGVKTISKGVKTRLNSCSERYELVPNREVFIPVKKVLDEKGIQYTEKYMHINHSRFYAEYMIMDAPHKVGGNANDLVYPMLKVQHSYNGLTKYMISFGYYRLVCTNGLTVPVKEKSEFNIAITGKHTSSIQHSLKKLMFAIDNFIQNGNKHLVVFDEMVKRTLLDPEQIKARVVETIEAAGINLVDNKKVDTFKYVNDVMMNEAVSLYGGVTNDFLIYNAVNRYIFDNSLNISAPEVRVEKDRKALQYLLKDMEIDELVLN